MIQHDFLEVPRMAPVQATPSWHFLDFFKERSLSLVMDKIAIICIRSPERFIDSFTETIFGKSEHLTNKIKRCCCQDNLAENSREARLKSLQPNVDLIQKSVTWFTVQITVQIKCLVSIWNTTLGSNGLNHLFSCHQYVPLLQENIRTNFSLTNINMPKVNKRNTSGKYEMCEIFSKLTIKTAERRQWRLSGICIANFKHISHLFLVFLWLLAGFTFYYMRHFLRQCKVPTNIWAIGKESKNSSIQK